MDMQLPKLDPLPPRGVVTHRNTREIIRIFWQTGLGCAKFRVMNEDYENVFWDVALYYLVCSDQRFKGSMNGCPERGGGKLL
jgi:hypothetical protein